MGDDHELRRDAHFLDEVGEAADVGFVEGGVDFVEDAERAGRELEDGCEQGNGGERFFSAGEEQNVLQLLAGRPGAPTFAGLAVNFAAVFDRQNLKRVAKVIVADPVIADTEAKLRRLDVLEAFDIAFADGEEAGQCVKDTEGCRLINSAKVGLGFVGPRYRF